MQQYVHPEYVCHKLRLTGQSWDSALLLEKGYYCALGKAKSSASAWRRRALERCVWAPLRLLGPGLLLQIDLFQLAALSLAPYPASAQEQMERGEQRRKGREIAPCSALGTSSGCECLQLVYCTPHAAMLFRAALKSLVAFRTTETTTQSPVWCQNISTFLSPLKPALRVMSR